MACNARQSETLRDNHCDPKRMARSILALIASVKRGALGACPGASAMTNCRGRAGQAVGADAALCKSDVRRRAARPVGAHNRSRSVRWGKVNEANPRSRSCARSSGSSTAPWFGPMHTARGPPHLLSPEARHQIAIRQLLSDFCGTISCACAAPARVEEQQRALCRKMGCRK